MPSLSALYNASLFAFLRPREAWCLASAPVTLPVRGHWVTMFGSYSALIAGGAGAMAHMLKGKYFLFRSWRALANQRLQLQPKSLRSMSGVFKALSCWMGLQSPLSVSPLPGR
ncbi:hypothetical protein AGR1B_Lc10033 [Agrobacterium fabacearum S56]|nr:hypothetical protein AGR1B_Lc10033 [Agrobacterium fabacearum S56]